METSKKSANKWRTKREANFARAPHTGTKLLRSSSSQSRVKVADEESRWIGSSACGCFVLSLHSERVKCRQNTRTIATNASSLCQIDLTSISLLRRISRRELLYEIICSIFYQTYSFSHWIYFYCLLIRVFSSVRRLS